MKARINLRAVLLIVLAVFAATFAYVNYVNKIQVWPLGGFYPLTFVIAIAFGLGLGVGVLGHSLLGLFRSRPRSLEGVPPTISAGERPHPGRP
jgi:hypothetical protein